MSLSLSVLKINKLYEYLQWRGSKNNSVFYTLDTSSFQDKNDINISRKYIFLLAYIIFTISTAFTSHDE